MPATRSSLLSRVRDFDDAEGWGEFDELYRPLLLGYARSCGLGADEAEEIAQQCLAAVVDRIQQFRRKRSFRGWLRKMVEHKVSDYLADHRRHLQADTDLLANAPSPAPSPSELWQRNWNQSLGRYLTHRLRSEFAQHTLQAFEMYVLHGYPVKQISRMLAMTPNQIYVAKSRIVNRLREERYADLLDSLYEVSP